MENKSAEEDAVVADASPPKWRTLVRQHSEKIGVLAEEVVLPKNQRISRLTSQTEDVAMQDVEAQAPYLPYSPTATVQKPSEKPILHRTRHFPVFMIGISLIQIILMYTVDEDLLLIVFGYDPHRRHELWRFITVMLAHSGFTHLWGNMFMQLILGVLLEIIHSWKRIAVIYLASVLGGTLFISVLHTGVYTVGASAGVYGLLFSHISTILLNWNEMDRKCCRVFWLLLYIVFDVGLNIYSELRTQHDSHTSHAGHLGGAITGFLVSILVLKNFEELPWEKKMQKVCVRILIAICVFVLVVNVCAWGHYPPTEWNFQYADTYYKDVVKAINESAELTKLCEEEAECKLMLEQYNFNGTVIT